MRKYENHALPDVVWIQRRSWPGGAFGPKYRSIDFASPRPFNSNNDRSAALS